MNQATQDEKGFLFFLNYQDLKGDCTQQILNNKFNLASTRLQIQPALKAALSISKRSHAISLLTDTFSLIEDLGNPRACIFSKIGNDHPTPQNTSITISLAIAARMKARGIPIVTLYSDNHISNNTWAGNLYRDILTLSDSIIYPSLGLQKQANLAIKINAQEHIIEDLCCIEEKDFKRIRANETIKVIWFGHSSNLKYLIKHLPDLLKTETQQKIQLSILTSRQLLKQLKSLLLQIPTPKNWDYRLIGWENFNQPAQLQSELSDAHICWIPSDHTDRRKAGASHNRLVDAVNAGCITIASPLPSYKELADVALIGYDYASKMLEAINSNTLLIDKFNKNRKTTLSRFQPQNNEKKWTEILKLIG